MGQVFLHVQVQADLCWGQSLWMLLKQGENAPAHGATRGRPSRHGSRICGGARRRDRARRVRVQPCPSEDTASRPVLLCEELKAKVCPGGLGNPQECPT
jgi:hypothetical protein